MTTGVETFSHEGLLDFLILAFNAEEFNLLLYHLI